MAIEQTNSNNNRVTITREGERVVEERSAFMGKSVQTPGNKQLQREQHLSPMMRLIIGKQGAESESV